MRRLIINADDFGMSKEVNEGIMLGIKAGMINSTSLMTNMPCFDEAVDFLKKYPKISIGLHFNITEGHSVLKPAEVSSILREDNNFFHWHGLVLKLVHRKASIEHIGKELDAQYSRLAKTGLHISHIDSHHHIHLYPLIYSLVQKLAHDKKVFSLRSRNFNFWGSIYGFQHRLTRKQLFIQSLYYFNAVFTNKKNRNGKSLVKVNGIFDLNWDRDFDEGVLSKIISSLPDGITEIICHPAVMSKNGNPEFLRPRQLVLDTLLKKSIKDVMKKNNIEFYSRNEERK